MCHSVQDAQGLTPRGTVYSLEQQITHKQALLAQHFAVCGRPVVLLGHSIGEGRGWMGPVAAAPGFVHCRFVCPSCASTIRILPSLRQAPTLRSTRCTAWRPTPTPVPAVRQRRRWTL